MIMNHTNSSSLSITTKLPTKEEFEASITIAMEGLEQYSEPKYLCPECKEGGMRKNLTMVLTTYPIKYLYVCNKCGYVEYQNM